MPDKMRRDISLKMAIIARQMRAHFDEAVADLGVTRSQWSAIVVVAGNPGATQRVIAEKLEISEASAGRLVDKLSAEGFVERRPKEDDKRAHCVHLTDAGRELTGKLAELGRNSEAAAFVGIEDADLAKLEELLGKIAANLNRRD